MILHFVGQNKQTRRITDFLWFWNDVSAQKTNLKSPQYRQPERKIDSNAPFQHLDILLQPVKKPAPAEPTPRGKSLNY